MKYFSIIIICFLLICCTKEKEHSQPVKKINNTVSKINKNKTEAKSNNEDIDVYKMPREEKGLFLKEGTFTISSDAGITCLTNVIDNNVNVRNYPSLEAEVICQLDNDDIIRIVGFSGEKENIGNFYGDWLNILYQKSEDEYINGWVFSKYVNMQDREYTPMQISSLNPQLKIAYTLQGNEVFDLPDYTEWKNYYIIVRSIYDNYYHYSNKPGIYLLDKETDELKHVTYMGSYVPTAHAWTVFTDDFEYLIQDSGTNAGVRGITVWKWKELKEVFSGIYLKDPKINNHTIEIIYRYDDWSFEQGHADEEIMLFGKMYEEKNPIPQEMLDKAKQSTIDIELVIRCSYNLDTGERKILGGEYIYKQ